MALSLHLTVSTWAKPSLCNGSPLKTMHAQTGLVSTSSQPIKARKSQRYLAKATGWACTPKSGLETNTCPTVLSLIAPSPME